MKLMKQWSQRVLQMSMALLLCFSLVLTSVNAQETLVEYEIYPGVQKITYGQGFLSLNKKVNLVADDSLDQATKNHIVNTFTSAGYTITESAQADNTALNVYAGSARGTDAKHDLVKSLVSVSAGLFDKSDAHIINVSDKGIVLYGKDTDATFFAMTSLMHLLNQAPSEMRHLEIEDYSDTILRGFIEGYYGIPWSNEDRMSLMRFGSQFKMNTYLFAPKDDVYHNSRWREPYPTDILQEIKEMAAVGNETKNRFVWTIHPFMNNGIRFDDNYAADLAAIITKFESLYDVGVRQFGVLADDVGGEAKNPDNQSRLMNDLHEWNLSKEGNYNLIFVPSNYNTSWAGSGDDLKVLNRKFPSDIHIMWTGDSVLGHVNPSAINNFKRLLTSDENPGRNPYFWLNWPVNDVNSRRLIMGPGEMLHTDVTNLDGIANNPMQQAEASKVSLFAVADFAWNIAGFKKDKSWSDSFKFIDPDVGGALREVSKHMQDPAPNGHGLVLPESEELNARLTVLINKINAKEDFVDDAKALIGEFDKIANASDIVITQSKNAKLVEEMKPWLESLRDQSLATSAYLKTAIALETETYDDVWTHFSNASALEEQSKTYRVQNINGLGKVEAGYKRLIPFMTKLSEYVAPLVEEVINPVDKLVMKPITNYAAGEIYQGNLNNLIDGNKDSSVWFGRYIKVGDYVGIEYNKPTTINSIELIQGTTAKPEDAFYEGVFEYSQDGVNWTLVNEEVYGPYQTNIEITGLNIEAQYVRFRATELKGPGEGNPKWVAFREFSINGMSETGTPISKTLITSSDLTDVYQGKEGNLTDGDLNTMAWYSVPGDNLKKGQYIGLDLGSNQNLGTVSLYQGTTNTNGDIMSQVTLEVSTDGVNYTKVAGPFNGNDIIANISAQEITARYVRFVNGEDTGKWAAFREIDVTTVNFNQTVYTNQDDLSGKLVSLGFDEFELMPVDNITLQPGKSFGLKLNRIYDITTIDTTLEGAESLKLLTGKNLYELEEYTSGSVDARYVILRNDTNAAVTFSVKNFTGKTNEVQAAKLHSTTISSHEGALNALDGDINSDAWFKTFPRVGQNFVYDLGRDIKLNHFKMLVKDSDQDFIRNAQISVSKDGVNYTNILKIGDDDIDNQDIQSVYPDREVSHLGKSVGDLDLDVRYIKLTITKDFDGKWMRFSEFVLNEGEYFSPLNNPTFEVDPVEERGFRPENLFDNDFKTAFKPGTSGPGSLVYHLSENHDINQIVVLQSSHSISHAKLQGRTVDNEWIDLGIIDKDYKIINFPTETILELRFEWDQATAPVIYEVYTRNVPTEAVDKTALKAKLDSIAALDGSIYTIDSWAKLQEVVVTAQAIYDSIVAEQSEVDAQIVLLDEAVDALVLIGNPEELNALLDEAETKVEADYTEDTWAFFKEIYDAVLWLDLSDATQGEIDALVVQMKQALNQLVKKTPTEPADTGDLEDVLDFAKSIDKDLYTDESVADLNDAIENTEVFLESITEETTQDVVDAILGALKDAIESLVLIEDPEEPNIPMTPLEPSTPAKPVDPVVPVDPVEPVEPVEPEKPTLPGTGVSQDYTVYIVGGLVLVAGVILVLVKRKKDKE